jgi:Uma2 family endonuclease
MNIPAQKPSLISDEEYLEGEKYTQIRHEYINGLINAMSGTSDKHGLIAGNVSAVLNIRLPDSCQVFQSDMKAHIKTQLLDIRNCPP